jgi:PAS domain S-box-containing protein
MAKEKTGKELHRKEMKYSRKKADKPNSSAKDLKKIQGRLEYLLSTSPAVIYTCEPIGDYRATFVSENIRDQLGYEPKEFVDKPEFWVNHIHPHDRRRVLNGLPPLFEHEQHVHEYRFKNKEGEYVWMRDELRLVLDEKGHPKEIVGCWFDITDLKQAEELLKERESRLYTILNSVQAGIVTIDAESRKIVEANPVAMEMIGLPKEKVIGRVCHKFICPAEKHKCPITDLGQTVDNSERVLLAADGKEVPILKTVASVILDGRKHLIESFLDITNLKLAEKELQEKQAALTAKSTELRQVNSALRVLLKQRDSDKKDLEQKVLSNVKDLVVPYIRKLKKSRLDDKQKAFLNILESNLNDIVSPFVHQLASKYSSLTPTQIQIAQLVKEGNSTKEIAELMGTSKRTVEAHRESIRVKLGLKNKKVNLRSYLSSM